MYWQQLEIGMFTINMGWGDGWASEVFVLKAQGPEFDAQKLCVKRKKKQKAKSLA